MEIRKNLPPHKAQVGDVRDTLPPEGVGRSVVDWEWLVRTCRRNPGLWVLASRRATRGVATTVRRKQATALAEVDDGKFQASMRHSRKGRGELWVKFVPYTDEELYHELQRRAEK